MAKRYMIRQDLIISAHPDETEEFIQLINPENDSELKPDELAEIGRAHV